MYASMDTANTFIDNDYCFACGSKNPLGLHLSFYREGDYMCTRVQPLTHWQGFEGVVHGGSCGYIVKDDQKTYG